MRYGWKRTGMYVNNRSWSSGTRLETERKSCVASSGERMAAHHDPKSTRELPSSLLAGAFRTARHSEPHRRTQCISDVWITLRGTENRKVKVLKIRKGNSYRYQTIFIRIRSKIKEENKKRRRVY